MLKTALIHLFVCLSLCNQTKSQDIYGVVSVGNITDLDTPVFAVTDNDFGGVITVNLLAVNDTSNGPVYQPNVEIDESVLVSCVTVTRYHPGDAVIEFVDEVLPRGELQADIFFNVSKQGRVVEVQCSGESTMMPGDSTNYFNFTTSQGPTGFVVVKKSPIVSFCDPVIQVPYAEAIKTSTVKVKLSEPVDSYDVIVSCAIVGVVDANLSLWVSFDDQVVSPGMDSVTMRYSIRRYGSVVLVACMANSTQGNQYVPSTSAGPQTTFVLDSGSVQLVPTVSNVYTPTFSAYLVLSDTLRPNEGDITFVCNLVPVNTTEFAQETIDNPSCVFEQPSGVTTQSPTFATPCPMDANSTCPTTEASPVSDAPNVTQISPWTLLTSEFVFQEGEVFKVVHAQLKSLYGSHKGALVLTCCAAYDVNSSPKYTNASDALVILSEVEPVRTLNASAIPGTFLGLQETELLNPAYIEVSPCPCDLYESKCDTDCCCDMDCSEVDISLFTCTEGVEGGNFSALPDYLCDSASLYRSDWWPFLCVQVSNSPHLGLYYNTIVGLKDISSFNSFKSQTVLPTTTSFEDTSSRELDFDESFGSVGYRHGYPVELMYDGNLRGYLTLPVVALRGDCHHSAVVKFQEDGYSECTKLLEPSSCADYTPFSARWYLQPSATSFPPCPAVPRVIAGYGQASIAGTSVSYLCLGRGVESYLRSQSESLPNATQTELFKEAGSMEDGGEEDGTSTRCEWDDGFTVPPTPTLNDDTKDCDNVVLDVDYQLFWRGSAVVSVEVTILLGSVPLPETSSIPKPTDDTTFITPPPFPETEPTTVPVSSTATPRDVDANSTITATELVTDFDDVLVSLETDETFPPITASPTEGTTPVPTTQILTTSPAGLTTPTATSPTMTPDMTVTDGRQSTSLNGDNSTVTDTPMPMMTTSSVGNDSDTDDRAVQREVRSVTQRFRTTFTYQPSVVSDRVTRLYEADPVQSSRSGNPGYNTGAPVLSGVAVYEMVETTTSLPVNCTADPQDLSCNETRQDNTVFTTVDVSNGNRIQMIMPGSNGLCSEATSQEIYFGENTLSGCFLRLSLSDLSNCTELRKYMKENLRTFVAADVIGKTGVADILQESNWAAIIAADDDVNVDDSGPIQPTGTSVTTESPLTTEYPNQTFIQDPTPPQILDQLNGICFDVPTGVNLEVIITDAGEYNGFMIQEIVSAKISYTTSVVKMNCMGANAVRCQSTNTTTGVDEEYVQSFMVTSSVTFIKVPPIPPESVILYYKDYNPALCKQDSCLRGIFYPFTESFEGDSFEYSLAVTMITILVATGYVIVTTPWLGLKMW